MIVGLPLTAKTRVRPQTNSRRVYRVKSVNETRFSTSTSVSPASAFPPISHAHFHSFIATRYGLDGPGIKSRRWSRFSTPVQTGPGNHPASYTMVTASFQGVKRAGHGFNRPPPSSVEVKERIELYLYSRFGPSWPVVG